MIRVFSGQSKLLTLFSQNSIFKFDKSASANGTTDLFLFKLKLLKHDEKNVVVLWPSNESVKQSLLSFFFY